MAMILFLVVLMLVGFYTSKVDFGSPVGVCMWLFVVASLYLAVAAAAGAAFVLQPGAAP